MQVYASGHTNRTSLCKSRGMLCCRVFHEPCPSLFLVFWISLVNFEQGISLVILVFSLSSPRISWVRQGQKILGNFEVFLDKNKKPKERTNRENVEHDVGVSCCYKYQRGRIAPWRATGHCPASLASPVSLASLDGQNRQSPIASVQRTQSLSQAIPQFHVERILQRPNRAIRIAVQRTQGLRGPI